MTMSEGMVGPGALSARRGRLELAIRLPWYRSLPVSCLESVREPHRAWLAALSDACYAGAVVSEWGGHELLDRADADALTVTRDHLALLRDLAADRTAVTA